MYLPAEWHPQAFVQLTWPHADTDWAPMLDDVYACYLNMAREIAMREPLVVAAQHPNEVRSQLAELIGHAPHPIHIIHCPNNDTWARDHAFITLLNEDDTLANLVDFQFNGWGLKFPANLDNQINRNIYDRLPLPATRYINRLSLVLEGGSIESDGRGTILTTTSCLTAPNRNELQKDTIEHRLQEDLHAQRVLWLEHGHLAGDDTDGHIDTLARLCPDDTIAYVQCSDTSDEHCDDLKAMEDELRAFRTAEGRQYRLIPLPLPDAIHDENGQRLPATYANFLIVNGAVLYPTYRQPENDEEARRQLQKAFPQHDIVGIDSTVLIRQHGSLHCCTMQYPAFRA